MVDYSKFQKGGKVFRRRDPGRIGFLTGIFRDLGGNRFYQVQFQDRTDHLATGELEFAGKGTPDAIQMIEQGCFGRAEDLRRILSHIHLNGRLASVIYSLDATNTDFYPHQFKPVLAFMESASRGLLIADEVGLGKTIEAGLIWTELRARYDCRRLLVVCPAMLCEKWRDELQNRFGIDARIMSATDLQADLQRSPDQVFDGKGIVCSIQSLRSSKELAKFFVERSYGTPIIDLVIIDEAHYLRNPERQSAKLGKRLRDVSENVILLSATPINLRSSDLFTLLNIVDPDMFAVPTFFPQVLEANEPLVRAEQLARDVNQSTQNIRLCLIKAAENKFFFGNTQLRYLIDRLEGPDSFSSRADRIRLADMISRINLLSRAVSRTRKIDVQGRRVRRKPKALFVTLGDTEKKFYEGVTEAVKSYAQEKRISDGFLLASPQRQVSSCLYAAAKSWKDREAQTHEEIREYIYEDIGAEVDFADDISPLIDRLTSEVLPSVSLSELWKQDGKFGAFHVTVKEYFAQYPQEKIVVFSYFRATLHYLAKRLREHGIASEVLMGGMRESKQEIIERFRTDDATKVLLSSEVASEGVDLQFCRMIVNYDLPWNPMKIEQRIGRLDRIGQEADEIIILNLGYADTIDKRIYDRLFERLEIFKRTLGGMDAILGEEIKNLTDLLVRKRLTPRQEEEEIEQTAKAIETNRQQEEKLEREASHLIAHNEYILDQVSAAYDRRITADDMVVYVKDYLDKHVGHEFYQPDAEKLRFHIRLPGATAAGLKEYIRKEKLRKHSKLETGERVLCEFVNKTSAVIGTVEQISQFHPLIRYISAQVSAKDLFPAIATKLQNKESETGLRLQDGQYAFAIYKWIFTGLRDEEDLRVRAEHIECGQALDADESWKLLNAARLNGRDWPEAGNVVDSSLLVDKVLKCYLHLEQEFQFIQEEKETENSDRINFQIQSAERHRDRQLNSLEGVLLGHQAQNRKSMIRLTEGRIEKIRSRFGVQIEELKNKKKMQPLDQKVCCGVLLLENSEG